MSSPNSSNSRTPSSNLFRTYDRSSVVVVHKTKEAFGGLSNMAAGFPLYVNGVRIPTSEALYQACRFPFHPEVQQAIIGQFSPMTAKMRAKARYEDSRPDWNDVRFKVMRWCLRVKLAQNFDDFGRLLLATEDKSIVELSTRDDYWGAKPTDDSTSLVGQNVLGRLLMELRELMVENGQAPFEVIAPLAIPDFLFLGRPIEPVTARRPSTVRQTPLFD